MATEMKIGGYLQTSLIDWPGKIAAVVFTVSCNFRCPFCHNADLVLPEKIKRIYIIPEKEILADLKKRKKWIDGVVVTGGESTLQDDLSGFLDKCRRMGFMTMIETNGSQPEVIHNLLTKKLLNYVAMDYKGPIEEYAAVSGGKIKNEKLKIENSMKLLVNSHIPFEFRTTVVPGIHDETTIKKMGRELRQLTINDSRLTIPWYLQAFQPKNCLDPEFMKVKPFTAAMLKKLLAAAKKEFPLAELR
ncbi:MAG: anaerobic ribonucleoside-triphosphate reductase activating protein [bacterium]|nr:anaerobic ribonucleoside-triphosphate reductase activating protein [bacterium]